MELTHLRRNGLGMGLDQVGQLRFDNLLLSLWAHVSEALSLLLDSVDVGLLREVFGLDKPLDTAVIHKLLPIVHLLEHIHHGSGHLSPRLAHHARMVILSSTKV